MYATLFGVMLLLLAAVDSFEAMVLPRRVTRRWRPTRLYYHVGWRMWRSACRIFSTNHRRETALSIFGPLSLLGLFSCWVLVLITGFGFVHWGQRTLPGRSGEELTQCLYHSGETFFTLGYGDITPDRTKGKILSVVEAGSGFGFMALIIGYLPVLYQAFSRRERNIALLDARAGSPPTAGEMLRRTAGPAQCQVLEKFLAEWEVWAAELLESHLSFPVLSYYRSQHDNQSWLAGIALVLDVSAVELATAPKEHRRQAELTFAMARHACVDLCLVLWLPPVDPPQDRLTPEQLDRLLLAEPSAAKPSEQDPSHCLGELRELYEPFLEALSRYFCFTLPKFFPERQSPDNWQTSAWTKRAPDILQLPAGTLPLDKHFG